MDLVGGWSRVKAAVPARVVDAGLGFLLCASVLGRGFGEGRLDGWAVVVAAVLAGGSVALRRAMPVPALASAGLAGVLLAPFGMTELGVVAIGLAGYTVGTVRERIGAVVIAGLAAIGVAVGAVLAGAALDAYPAVGPEPLVAVVVTGVAVGQAVRSGRELALALQERVRRRAVEERLHIAREVHDVVGHHIAVINVQSAVAAHHLHDRPAAAEEALGHVRVASRTVLDELAAVLQVLRGPGAENGSRSGLPPTEPVPGLARLDRLVASFAAAGIEVEWTVTGEPRDLPAAIDLSAYRTIQESLTNAGKHGKGVVRLRLRYTASELRIEVRNALGPPGAGGAGRPAPGYGLVGIAERVAAVNGTVSAGPLSHGEFVVLARLPVAMEGETT